MTNNKYFDVIIVGGSYAGLSAAMTLGRSLRKVLIIDNGKPCNQQTPHSHNFLTNDGKTPTEISAVAKSEVKKYDTITFYEGLAVKGLQTDTGFKITTHLEEVFHAKKLVFATGVKDILPKTPGFTDCWGITIIHCPYCHGYEVRNKKTGILGNGDYGFEFSKMLQHWTKDLTLFTNGPSTLTEEQKVQLQKHNIAIIESKIASYTQTNGILENIVFVDGSIEKPKAIYAKVPFKQHTNIPFQLGCNLTEEGYLEVNALQETNINGIFACGDNTTFKRSVANAVAAGNLVGTMANKELILEEF